MGSYFEGLFHRLPDELLVHVLSLLDEESRWAARLVSKKWAAAGIGQTWRFRAHALSDLEGVVQKDLRVKELELSQWFSAESSALMGKLACLSMLTSLRFNAPKISGAKPLISAQHFMTGKVPDLSALPCGPRLQKLVISGIQRMDMGRLGQLRALQELHLELGYSDPIDLQPLSQLAHLTRLQIDSLLMDTDSLNALAVLTQLRELRLSQLTLVEAPRLSRLTNLRLLELDHVDLAGDSEDEDEFEIDFVESLAALEQLTLRLPEELPAGLACLSQLSSLLSLSLEYMDDLHGSLPAALTSLTMALGNSVLTFAATAGMPTSRRLVVKAGALPAGWRAPIQWQITPLTFPQTLEYLRLEMGNERLPYLELGKLHRLQQLELVGVGQLSLAAVHVLPELQKLAAVRCGFSRLEGLGSGCRLESIRLERCQLLRELPSLAEASSLREVILRECNSLHRVPLVGQRLRKLIVKDCVQLGELPSLTEATALTKLAIWGCPSLLALPALSPAACGGLLRLTLGDLAFNWQPWPGPDQGRAPLLNSLTALQSLKLLRLGMGPVAIPGLARRTMLRQLHIAQVGGLRCLSGLDALTGLTSMEVRLFGAELRGSVRFPELRKMPYLRHLGFDNSVAKAHSLELIRLVELRSLRFEVDDWENWDHLKGLWVLRHLSQVAWGDAGAESEDRAKVLRDLQLHLKRNQGIWQARGPRSEVLEFVDGTTDFFRFVNGGATSSE